MPITTLLINGVDTPSDWVAVGGSKSGAVGQFDNADGKGNEAYIKSQGEDVRQWFTVQAPSGKGGASYIPADAVIHRAIGYAFCKSDEGKFAGNPIEGKYFIPPDFFTTHFGELPTTFVDVCFEGSPVADDMTASPGPYELMLGATIPAKAGFAGDDTVGDDSGTHFSVPLWTEGYSEWGQSHVHNGKGVRQKWDRSYLDNMKVGIRSKVVDVSGGGPEPIYLDGGTRCTWIRLDIEWGDRFHQCSQCCCCCLCACPVVVVEGGLKIGLNNDPDGGPFYTSPKFCFRVCNNGPLIVGGLVQASCWFYCYPVDLMPDPPPPCTVQKSLFADGLGNQWELGDAVILAGETLHKGCLQIYVTLACNYPDPDNPGSFLSTPGLIFRLGASTLIQCAPYHLSSIAPGDDQVDSVVFSQPGAIVEVPKAGTQVGGESATWDVSPGFNYTVTCKPYSGSGSGSSSGGQGLPLGECAGYE